jgi:hypothetical protein
VLDLIQILVLEMVKTKVQKLVYEMMQQNEEPVRFSITLSKTDNARLEELAEYTGCSKSALCSRLLSAALDDAEAMFDTPESDVNPDLPSVDEYVAAFSAIQAKLTDGHRAMLSAHYHAPNYRTTATKLAEAAGYKSYGGANLQYARLGMTLAEYLSCPLPRHLDGAPFPTALLVEWTQNPKEEWYCTLHPQVVKALEIVGLTEG